MRRLAAVTAGTSLACCALLLLALLAACAAKPWTPGSFPNPGANLTLCGRRGVRSRVCDPDGVLTYEGANVLEATLADIAEARAPFGMSDCARNPGELPGYEVAVALMQQMGVREDLPVNDQARGFAEELMTAWGVGNAACNDGVLLLLSKQPREVYVYAGAGAAPRLTPQRILTVIANMRPELRAGDFDAALQRGAVDIGLVLSTGRAGHEDGGFEWGKLLKGSFWFMLLGGVIGLSWWNGRKRRQQVRAVQALVDKLKREQAVAAATHAYPALSCPVCFEDFEDAAAPQPAPSAPPLPAEGFRDPAGRSSGATETSRTSKAEGEREGEAAPVSDAELCSPLLPPLGSQHSGHGTVADVRKRLVLPCGHTFCESCISQWVKAHETCPICREPLVAQPAPAAPAFVERYAPGRHEQELMFRLLRIQRGYPSIVDDAMVRHWSADARAGRPIEWSSARWHAEQQRQLHDPQLRAERASAGAHGAGGASFGGGGGGGGGGGAGACW